MKTHRILARGAIALLTTSGLFTASGCVNKGDNSINVNSVETEQDEEESSDQEESDESTDHATDALEEGTDEAETESVPETEEAESDTNEGPAPNVPEPPGDTEGESATPVVTEAAPEAVPDPGPEPELEASPEPEPEPEPSPPDSHASLPVPAEPSADATSIMVKIDEMVLNCYDQGSSGSLDAPIADLALTLISITERVDYDFCVEAVILHTQDGPIRIQWDEEGWADTGVNPFDAAVSWWPVEDGQGSTMIIEDIEPNGPVCASGTLQVSSVAEAWGASLHLAFQELDLQALGAESIELFVSGDLPVTGRIGLQLPSADGALADEYCTQLDDLGYCHLGVEQQTFYRDADGDGFGSPNTSMDACAQPMGWVDNGDDCCDLDDDAFPGQDAFFSTEVVGCGGYDHDCDGLPVGEALLELGDFSLMLENALWEFDDRQQVIVEGDVDMAVGLPAPGLSFDAPFTALDQEARIEFEGLTEALGATTGTLHAWLRIVEPDVDPSCVFFVYLYVRSGEDYSTYSQSVWYRISNTGWTDIPLDLSNPEPQSDLPELNQMHNVGIGFVLGDTSCPLPGTTSFVLDGLTLED